MTEREALREKIAEAVRCWQAYELTDAYTLADAIHALLPAVEPGEDEGRLFAFYDSHRPPVDRLLHLADYMSDSTAPGKSVEIGDRVRLASDIREIIAALTAASPWREGWRTVESANLSELFGHSTWVQVATSSGRVTEATPFRRDDATAEWIWVCARGVNCADPRHPTPYLRERVTHWMPLPAPPPGQETGDAG